MFNTDIFFSWEPFRTKIMLPSNLYCFTEYFHLFFILISRILTIMTFIFSFVFHNITICYLISTPGNLSCLPVREIYMTNMECKLWNGLLELVNTNIFFSWEPFRIKIMLPSSRHCFTEHFHLFFILISQILTKMAFTFAFVLLNITIWYLMSQSVQSTVTNPLKLIVSPLKLIVSRYQDDHHFFKYALLCKFDIINAFYA